MTDQYLKVHTVYKLNCRIQESYVQRCEREEITKIYSLLDYYTMFKFLQFYVNP